MGSRPEAAAARPLRSVGGTSVAASLATAEASAIASDVDRKFKWILAFWISLMGWFAATQMAWGQATAFEPIERHPAFANEKTVDMGETELKKIARGDAANGRVVQMYLQNYLGSLLSDPTQTPEAAEILTDLRKMMAQASRNPAALPKLNAAIFQSMQPIALGNHPPPARGVAISLISALDSKPLDQRNRTAPVPYGEALPVLLRVAFNDANPDGVKAAALVGVHRHVMLGSSLPANVQAGLRSKMNELLSQVDPPKGRDETAHAFLQRYAVDILGQLRDPRDASFGTQLISITQDVDQRPNVVALHSASKLADVSDSLKDQVNQPGEILRSWTRRLLTAMEEEQSRFDAMEKPKPAPKQPRDPKTFLTEPTEEVAKTRMMDPSMMMDGSMMEMGGYDAEMESMMGMQEEMMMGGMEGMDMMDMMGGFGFGGATQVKEQPPMVKASLQKINVTLEQLHRGATGQARVGEVARPGGLLAAVAEADRPAVTQWMAEIAEFSTAINDETLDNEDKYREALDEQVAMLREKLGLENEEDPLTDPAAPVAPAGPAMPDELAGIDPLDAPAAAAAPAAAEDVIANPLDE